MGNILFLAGERRSACALSKFLFHPFHWTLHGAVDHTRMMEYAASLEHDLMLYEEIVRQRTLEAPQFLDIRRALTAYARIVEPKEALELGLIHEIDAGRMGSEDCQWSVHA
jgi:ATP-dependent protease ClpP protease subunit